MRISIGVIYLSRIKLVSAAQEVATWVVVLDIP
jgi:hypothetical protein